MPPAKACDRCHGIKARCHFSDDQDACDRCLRLLHKCQTARKEGKAGRPRSRGTSTSSQMQRSLNSSESPRLSDYDASLGSHGEGLRALQDFEPSEVAIAQYLVQDRRLDQRFANSFAIESFYSNTMESSLIRQLLSVPAQVKDALLSLSGALIAEAETHSTQTTTNATANIDRCCRAIERLRLTDSASEDDAKAILFVATSLISFNDLTIGHGFLPVARAALLATTPWFPQLLEVDSSHLDPHLIPVVFAEVMECVKCREVPTFRWTNPAVQLVDRSYGIAQEVLPFLYNICVLGCDMKDHLHDAATVKARANEISKEVRNWIPEIRPNVADGQGLYLSQSQTAKIIRHAECYKLLAQLLLKQLQCQTEDDHFVCTQLAEQIRYHVTSFFTEETHQVLYLLFPYFVACTELEDKVRQASVLDEMKYLSGGIATQSCNRMYEFLQSVWANRAINSNTTWLELVEQGSDFSIGP